MYFESSLLAQANAVDPLALGYRGHMFHVVVTLLNSTAFMQ